MTQASQLTRKLSTSKLLAVVGIIAVITGAIVGVSVGYAIHYTAPTTRVFYLFNNSLPFNSTNFGGIPHDTFSPDRITVDKGDTVVIHYVNIEDQPEVHTFTMYSPYDINYFVPQGQNITITFKANWAGVFAYYCTIHQPTMTGYLVVLG